MSRNNNLRIVLIRLDFMEINRHNDTVEDRLTVRPAAIDSAMSWNDQSQRFLIIWCIISRRSASQDIYIVILSPQQTFFVKVKNLLRAVGRNLRWECHFEPKLYVSLFMSWFNLFCQNIRQLEQKKWRQIRSPLFVENWYKKLSWYILINSRGKN
jgi:hypothetical protein